MVQPMRVQPAWILLAGVIAGILVVWAYLAGRPAPVQTAAAPAVPTASAVQPPAVAATAARAVAAAPAPSAGCAFEPLLASGAGRDGQFALDAALKLHQSTDPAPFLAVADEAAREARPRDAEVALIAACRIAGQAGASSAPLADVQARLAHHYAAVADADPASRGEVLARAESLLTQTVKTYSAALGEQASKTRLAQQRLDALHAPAPAAPLVVTTPDPSVPVVIATPTQPTTRMGAARFSLTERPPGLNEDLRKVDDDVQRLYDQARRVTRDPVGLQRRQQQALAARAACHDEACLRRWYAQRRKQLFAEF